MNKQEFLEYLEKRLSVLNKREREDIITEYSQHIDIKVASGMSEQDVIREFGDPKTFADEILEAYNIDPEYEDEMEHNRNIMAKIKKIKTSVEDAIELLLAQSPRVLFSMLVRIGVISAVVILLEVFMFCLVAEFTDEVIMHYLSETIGWLLLIIYITVAVAFGGYIIVVYIGKLVAEVKQKGALHGTGILIGIKGGVDAFADFIITQRPTALIVMLFKLFIMSVVLFMLGLIGQFIPAIIAYITRFFIDSSLLYTLYYIIAFPIGIYVLYCYGARLVYRMTLNNPRKEKESGPMENIRSNSVEEKFSSSDMVSGSDNIENKSSVTSKKKNSVDMGFGETMASSIFNAAGAFIHLCWRAVCILFKLCVVCGLVMLFCMLVPVIVFTGAALIFALLGYPAIGAFIIGMGGCISCFAFMALVIRLVFMSKRVEGNV